jgi:hypothetical protein
MALHGGWERSLRGGTRSCASVGGWLSCAGPARQTSSRSLRAGGKSSRSPPVFASPLKDAGFLLFGRHRGAGCASSSTTGGTPKPAAAGSVGTTSAGETWEPAVGAAGGGFWVKPGAVPPMSSGGYDTVLLVSDGIGVRDGSGGIWLQPASTRRVCGKLVVGAVGNCSPL